MIGKPIDEIEEEHLQSLVDSKVAERKTLEYKRTLPGDSKHDKREFLADVSSFANASGGDIVYGMTAQAGVPTALDGLSLSDIDGAILRLESMARDGIRPRISGIQTLPVALSNSKVAIVLRVPNSWSSPHRVIYEGHDKFYSRSSNGKYPLDVDELRSSFIASETLAERIRDFRIDRISKISSDELPIPMNDNAKIVLHVIPIASFSTGQRYDINTVTSNQTRLSPIYCSGWNDRYNLVGLLAYSALREGKSHSYVQLYRNGIIEAVEGLLLRPHEDNLYIPSIAYEQELIASISEYLSILNSLSVEPPVLVFLSLLRVRGYIMAVRSFFSVETYAIDRDNLLLPEVIVENYNATADTILKPCFDAIWNACGYPRSLNYNDEGEWAPRR